MKYQRINDPTSISSTDIKSIIDSGETPVIQFCSSEYTDEILVTVNELCIQHGELLEVRFYGHYGVGFDAAHLAKLPNVRRLSLDCLSEVINIEELYKLNELRVLSFGVFEFVEKDFLSNINFQHITELVLTDNRNKNYNLSFLCKALLLKKLFIGGHSKNLEVLEQLPELKQLALGQMSKKISLSFLNRCRKLKELELILGGRENINEVSIPTLEVLRILRVRGFNSIGDLSRFPKLNCFHVEDQIKLESIDLIGCSLERLLIHNCKNLKLLAHIENQNKLIWFSVSRSALDLDNLKTANWPNSLKVLSLCGTSNKWNESCEEYLGSKGYVAYPYQANIEFD